MEWISQVPVPHSQGLLLVLVNNIGHHLQQGCLLLCIRAQTVEIRFVVEEVKITRMCLEQPLLTVNGMFPGPNITVTRNNTVNVNVLNNGPYPITIHWHGVKQHRNPWSDGPEYITQNPIPANGGSFKYTLVFSDEEGTLWWHAHSDWSRASVHGAIIVLPFPNKKYPFEPQPHHTQTIILGSWFNNRTLMEDYQNSVIWGGDVEGATSFAINGYPGQLETPCDDDMYKFVVDSGKNYHLRIINAVMEEEMFFAIAGHNFTVVGLDGAYLTPIPTNYIMITPGQTMDILLTTNQTPRSYYMGGKAFVDSLFGRPMNSTTRAILQYREYTGTEDPVDLGDLLPADPKNASYAKAFTERVRTSGLTGHDDYPITVPTDSEINKTFTITISVNTLPCKYPSNNCTAPQNYNETWTGMHAASLNNQRFVTQNVNILQAYRCNMEDVYTEDFPDRPEEFNYTGATGDFEEVPTEGTKVMTVNYGEAVEIVFQGTNVGNAENHPMHIHGYNFYLVGSDDGNFNDSSRGFFNLTSPAEANTFGVPKNGWLAVRFWAKNPGTSVVSTLPFGKACYLGYGRSTHREEYNY
ncbi:laccase-14-like [Rosa sericea]